MSEGTRGDLEFGTIGGIVASGAKRFGDDVAVIDGDVTLTYRGLLAAVREAARALVSLGVTRGDRVAIWAPNGVRWIVAALAVTHVGGVLVPINTRYKGDEAAFVLAKSRAKVLFATRGFLGSDAIEALATAETKTPELTTTVLLVGDPTGGAVDWNAFLSRAGQTDEATLDARVAAVSPGDLCDLLFTSGTTGRPKGVLCTHAQTLRAFRDWADVTGLRAGDRFLVVLPLFHSFGYKAGLLAALMMGATVLPEAVFDVGVVLRRVASDRISVLPGPPALYQSLLVHPELRSHDLSTLRLAVTGAAVIPVELVERMRSELGFGTVITGYGLTEATGVSTMCRASDDPVTIAQTSGRAIPDVEVRIVSPDGNELPRGEAGEIVVRGYTVTAGYFEDEAGTRDAIDAQGFLHTGDVGTMDERGYLKITDRLKDMFIVGGFNAYPAEIEACLLRHEAVAQAAVVGAPDERMGEVGVAFVVLRPGASASPEALIGHCRERIANFKVPRRVEIVAALPMNASNKVLKYKLRELARGLAS